MSQISNYNVETGNNRCFAVRDPSSLSFLHLDYNLNGSPHLRAVHGAVYNGTKTEVYCYTQKGEWNVSDSEVDHIRAFLQGRENSIPSELREAFCCPVNLRKQ